MNNNYLGQGPATPFKRDSAGVWKTAKNEELVLMGVMNAIFIGVGERPMMKEYGSRLSKIMFMNEDLTRNALVKQFVQEAVAQIEPRAVILSALAKDNSDEPNRVDISITWVSITANVPQNAVFPYYKGGM
jgi:phage baseplate assembly protein W